jgi:hypothetical protein
MHTFLKISDLIDDGPTVKLSPLIAIYASGVDLRWLGGYYRFDREDMLLLSADGLPYGSIRGADTRVNVFQQPPCKFSVGKLAREVFETANVPTHHYSEAP